MENSSLVCNGQVINPDYRGACAVYHGFSYMPESAAMGLRDEALEREFARVDSMGLNIARTWFRPDYSRERLVAMGRWLEKMKALGVEVAIHGGWWFPLDIWYFAHERYNDRTLTDSRESFETYCGKFASWIAKALEYYILVRKCTNIRYLCLFSEATTSVAGNLPVGMSAKEAYALCCRKVKAKITEMGLDSYIRVVGPGFNLTSHGGDEVRGNARALSDCVDIFSGHAYANTKGTDRRFVMTGYDGFLEHARILRAQFGNEKPLWYDEYGLCGEGSEKLRSLPWYGNFIAQALCAFANGGLQASFLWLLFDCRHARDITNSDSFYHGVHRWGTAYMPGDSVKEPENVRPAWYVISLCSRYLCGCNGGQVLGCAFDRGICGCVTVPEKDRTTALAVNRTGVARRVTFDLSTQSGEAYTVYVYDPATVSPSPDLYLLPPCDSKQGKVFEVILPPNAVALVTDFDGGKKMLFPDPPQPELPKPEKESE